MLHFPPRTFSHPHTNNRHFDHSGLRTTSLHAPFESPAADTSHNGHQTHHRRTSCSAWGRGGPPMARRRRLARCSSSSLLTREQTDVAPKPHPGSRDRAWWVSLHVPLIYIWDSSSVLFADRRLAQDSASPWPTSTGTDSSLSRTRCSLIRPESDCARPSRYGFPMPRTRARDTYYKKLEEERAAKSGS